MKISERRKQTVTDSEIITLFNARDESAIRETDRAYGKLCQDLALRILGDPSDAEECVNDTWLRVWNAIPPAAPPSLRAYLCKIVRRLAIDRYRMESAAKRQSHATIALDEVAPYLTVPPEEESNLPRLIEDFLRAEDPLDRRLFMGRYWHAYPVKDMARHYGLSANAVSHRLNRTRGRLRAYLNERGYSL